MTTADFVTVIILLAACCLTIVLLRKYLLYQVTSNVKRGVVTLPNGSEYSYIQGDGIRGYTYGVMYSGIDIVLPKILPHMYLDSMKTNGRLAGYVIEPSQKISLEGDFNDSFTLYMPKNCQVVGLSIMTPDVMHTILQQSHAYDIEIWENHLRLISNKPVVNDSIAQAELLVVARAVLVELDHKFQSWTESDEVTAKHQKLTIYPHKGLRVFGRYVLWQHVAVMLSLSFGGVVSVFGGVWQLITGGPLSTGIQLITGGLVWLSIIIVIGLQIVAVDKFEAN